MAIVIESDKGIAKIHLGRRLHDGEAATTPVGMTGIHRLTVRCWEHNLAAQTHSRPGRLNGMPCPKSELQLRIEYEHREGGRRFDRLPAKQVCVERGARRGVANIEDDKIR